MATSRTRRQLAACVLLWGVLVGTWIGQMAGVVEAQPFSAQIVRALQAIGLSGSPGVWTVPVKLADGTGAAPALAFNSDPTTGWYRSLANQWTWEAGTVNYFTAAAGVWRLAANTAVGWTSTNDSTGTVDTILVRDGAANTLALRNGTNVQTFLIYNTFTDASNYERGFFKFASNQLQIGTQSAGTGVARDMVMSVATGRNAYFGNATGLWLVDGGASSAWRPNANNSQDIGTASATVRTGYFGTSVISAQLQGSGTGVTVANVGANSCGTTAATIAGNQVSGVITVGATSGTQCRVTFSTAATTARDCVVTDSTTTIATRATYVDTTHTDFLGAFVAGDNVTYACVVR